MQRCTIRFRSPSGPEEKPSRISRTRADVCVECGLATKELSNAANVQRSRERLPLEKATREVKLAPRLSREAARHHESHAICGHLAQGDVILRQLNKVALHFRWALAPERIQALTAAIQHLPACCVHVGLADRCPRRLSSSGRAGRSRGRDDLLPSSESSSAPSHRA